MTMSGQERSRLSPEPSPRPAPSVPFCVRAGAADAGLKRSLTFHSGPFSMGQLSTLLRLAKSSDSGVRSRRGPLHCRGVKGGIHYTTPSELLCSICPSATRWRGHPRRAAEQTGCGTRCAAQEEPKAREREAGRPFPPAFDLLPARPSTVIHSIRLIGAIWGGLRGHWRDTPPSLPTDTESSPRLSRLITLTKKSIRCASQLRREGKSRGTTAFLIS
ncbi:hypothetical protein SKAU_G00353300 [Synaphobranchus kaupii]|uniref:Uncharacterized protein n=1 Tax=Synaphobranchus kaupii TaxID=118154 RepID=A0A9Q1II55_SYNKA|nr:hypothetical protein SKAU_G00353300 [Synaphobranchus kaupii]